MANRWNARLRRARPPSVRRRRADLAAARTRRAIDTAGCACYSPVMPDSPRRFTVAEANALVPVLEVRFAQVLQLRTRLRIVHRELEALGETPSPETLARTGGPPELLAARGRFRALVAALTDEARAIEEAGVVIKDVETGLCDFLGQRAGRDVWLCWRLGEKRVAFWHDLEAGFAGRQPIDAAMEAGQPTPGPRVLH